VINFKKTNKERDSREKKYLYLDKFERFLEEDISWRKLVTDNIKLLLKNSKRSTMLEIVLMVGVAASLLLSITALLK
jgi:hypothetical protein